MPFLDDDVEIRKVLCSTNAIGFHIRWKRKRGTNKWYVPRQRRDLTYSSRSTLTGPTPSGSADAPRLCRGCSHPHRHLPGQAAPSFRGLPRQPTGAGISPPLKQQRLTAHETRPERVRHHLRRPAPPGQKLIMRPDQIHRLSDTSVATRAGSACYDCSEQSSCCVLFAGVERDASGRVTPFPLGQCLHRWVDLCDLDVATGKHGKVQTDL